MVAADVVGVLFTRNPVMGTDEIVVEAMWGLGEAIVPGLLPLLQRRPITTSM
jgi:pyruvate,water dikinase